MSLPKLTKEQAIVIMGFTGISTTLFSNFQEDVQKRLGRPVWTHEFANKDVMEQIKAVYKDDFIAMCGGE